MEISQLFIYPIKSLGGISLNSSLVEERGLQYDRRWMLVDQNNVFMSQRTLPKMAAFEVSIINSAIRVLNNQNNECVDIPFQPETDITKTVKVWDDTLASQVVSHLLNEWFSDQMNMQVNLVYQKEDSIRSVDKKYAVTGREHTSFSDGYPILIISEASLDYLNEFCSEKIEMKKFRPNIVIKDCEPFFEDNLKEIKIGDTKLQIVKPCARCQMPTLDYKTFQFSKEPTLTLSKIRKFDNKILFGQNVVVHQTGNISIGDIIS